MALRALFSRRLQRPGFQSEANLIGASVFPAQSLGLQTFSLPDLPSFEPAGGGEIKQLHDASAVAKLQSAIKFNGGGVRATENNDRKGFNNASFWLHNHRQTSTLSFNSVGLRAFSTASVESTVPREIRTAESKPIGTAKKVISFTLLPNLALFWHINEGIEEILADYVHQEMTRNLILINLRLFLIILAKDVFLSLV